TFNVSVMVNPNPPAAPCSIVPPRGDRREVCFFASLGKREQAPAPPPPHPQPPPLPNKPPPTLTHPNATDNVPPRPRKNPDAEPTVRGTRWWQLVVTSWCSRTYWSGPSVAVCMYVPGASSSTASPSASDPSCGIAAVISSSVGAPSWSTAGQMNVGPPRYWAPMSNTMYDSGRCGTPSITTMTKQLR